MIYCAARKSTASARRDRAFYERRERSKLNLVRNLVSTRQSGCQQKPLVACDLTRAETAERLEHAGMNTTVPHGSRKCVGPPNQSRSAGLWTPNDPLFNTCVYIIVVRKFEWPSNS